MKVDAETVEKFAKAILLYEKREDSAEFSTLNEKMLHSVIKSTVADDPSECEVRIDGHNIADVLKNNTVYEVQTESLYPVKKKLDYYLRETCFDVDIVFPIARKKYTSWADPETGEIYGPNPTNKKRTILDEADEINYVAEYISNPRVRLTILYIAECEMRRLDGKRSKDRKRGSTRIERRPIELFDGEEFSSFDDFTCLLPKEERFTRKMYKTEKKIRSSRKLYGAINILEKSGLVEKDGVDGRAIIYKTLKK